jgi:hypothetical protein
VARAVFATDGLRRCLEEGEQVECIQHGLDVAGVLANAGGITDTATLVAALVRDVFLLGQLTGAELTCRCGTAVRRIVEELTNRESLDAIEPEGRQTGEFSLAARNITVADLAVLLRSHPRTRPGWYRRPRALVDWTPEVVEACAEVSPGLRRAFGFAHRRAESEARAESRKR